MPAAVLVAVTALAQSAVLLLTAPLLRTLIKKIKARLQQ